MLIGILQCDDVRASLSTEFGEYPEMFKCGFQMLDNSPFTFMIYDTHKGILPEKPQECDAYLITGSRHSLLENDEPWIHQLQLFIVRLNKLMIKTIGVCFGHHIIAEAMGGKVERADSGWQIGVHCTKVLRQQTFMRPPEELFHIAMFSKDQVVSIDSAKVIAETDNCEFAMLQYGEHMLSIQGHPEFDQAFSKASLNAGKEDFPRKRFELGMESFSKQELDTKLLFCWFTNFLLDSKNLNLDQTDAVSL